MKIKCNFLPNKFLLLILLTGFGFKVFSQGQGNQGQAPLFYQFGGNTSMNSDERIGLKTNSRLSLITSDTARVDITKEGDMQIKKDVYLEKFIMQQTEKRLIEIGHDGKLQPMSMERLISGLFSSDCWEEVPAIRDPLLGGGTYFMQAVPAWAYKSGVIYTGSSCPAKVGIGTDNPLQRLDVRGSGYFSASLGIGTSSPQHKLHVHNGNILLTGSSSSLLFDNGGGTWGNWGIEYDSNSGGLNFWKPSGSSGGFGNYYLFLKNNGNVGIGTDNPQAKLHVKVDNDSDKAFAVYKGGIEQFLITGDGRFYARAYRIKMGNFPDYVFEDSYKRMTPQEKSEYFNKNKRLPYMPSAKEIENDGLDVGDGLIGITRNTEENSLDIIELFEKNKAIATMNEERDEKIKNLEMEIEELKKLIKK
ncbi:MAG: hypothetical protein M3Q58_11355 [Bacteroidota bacterium]|nr:hypothetical protein [Bacteroidota bacterium]